MESPCGCNGWKGQVFWRDGQGCPMWFSPFLLGLFVQTLARNPLQSWSSSRLSYISQTGTSRKGKDPNRVILETPLASPALPRESRWRIIIIFFAHPATFCGRLLLLSIVCRMIREAIYLEITLLLPSIWKRRQRQCSLGLSPLLRRLRRVGFKCNCEWMK